jgi:protein-disulfide isomerase
MKPHSLRRLAIVALLLGGAALGSAAVAAAPEQQTAADRESAEPAATDLETLRGDIELLKRGQDAIWQSLEEIKTLLRGGQQRPAQNVEAGPPNVIIDLQGHPIQGAAQAKLTVVEFSDYQCPYCARHMRDTFPLLDKEFIATGKVRYAMLDLPLRTHPFAFKAAEAATCAAGKGKFWEMHHLLFEKQDALGAEALPGYAEQIGIDRSEFEACLAAGQEQAVRADLAQAAKAGISATPTFVIGWLQDDDRLKPAEVIRGAQPYETFQRALARLLEQGPPSGNGE